MLRRQYTLSAAICAVFIIAALIGWGPAARAQGLQPEFRIMIMGDSLAEGLYHGVYNLVRGSDDIELLRLSKVGTGLFNKDMDLWRRKMTRVIDRQQPNMAVIMLGGNDPQPIRDGRARYAFRTPEWQELYRRRVNQYIEFLLANGVTPFWVGLPVMRDPEYDQDIQYLNDVYRAAAAEHNIIYVSTRELTAGEDNQYQAYGEALDGRTRPLRANDGKHFTLTGYELLGFHILKTIEYAVPDFRWDPSND
jgi:hypothetical protein